MADRTGYRIIVTGLVQGIGFRPHIWRLARAAGVTGTVKNTGAAVEILAEGNPEQLDLFVKFIHQQPLSHQRIDSYEITSVAPIGFTDFSIISSASAPSETTVISPDLPLCENCRKELFDPSSRRYRHFLNTCTACGPRFSVLSDIPYDRVNTSMADFDMCENCRREYHDPGDRRFHAETISCPDCGPYFIYRDAAGVHEHDDAFAACLSALQRGEAVMLKGIGGYHLACSPFDAVAVQRLREIKGRENKPFAVMFRDLADAKIYCQINQAEEKLLLSDPRPIVPVVYHVDAFVPEVLIGDLRCGCFLPYTPLQALLLHETGPLIMTSANPSGSAIIYKDEDAFTFAAGHGIGVLYHARRILRPLEDPVAQAVDGTVQWIRLGRGNTPMQIPLDNPSGRTVLSLGGDLKSSFCLVKNNIATVSQTFGDLEDAGAYQNFQNEVLSYQHLFHVSPDLTVCDLHPGYISSNISAGRRVQHHHAHIASVMAEHVLTGKVLGAAFDGTGYGTDGTIWGGEFLVCEGAGFRRAAHLSPFPLTGGDAAAKHPWQTALCALWTCGIDSSHIDINHIDTAEADLLRAAWEQRVNTVPCSSMGRLFDAVSAILGLCSENTYEGEAAVLLERAAETAQADEIVPGHLHFDYNNDEITYREFITSVYQNRHIPEAVALGFHHAIADMIITIFRRLRDAEQTNQVALSGGVFQNRLLLSLSRKALTAEGFQVYINEKVPPGDGGICLGQAYIILKELEQHVRGSAHEGHFG